MLFDTRPALSAGYPPVEGKVEGDVDLSGLIDMHIHTAPDVRPRSLDDIDAARQAGEAGMRAIVLKSHITCTADRAALAQKMASKAQVLGGLTLNDAVGGLNPVAVEAALDLGARIIWMPTISAYNHRVKHGEALIATQGRPLPAQLGIRLLTQACTVSSQYSGGKGVHLGIEKIPCTERGTPSRRSDGELQPVLFDIFDLVKQYDAILATGHVSARESVALVRSARAAGVRKVVVTHPEVPWVDMPVGIQKELRDIGAYFERCYVSTLPVGGGVPFARIVSDIRQVGVESTVLATDFGAATLPPPVEGMRTYIAALLAEGFSKRDIQLMAGETPAMLLGLD